MLNTSPDEFEKQFPEEEYTKGIYSFTKSELSILNSYHSIKTMGEMAETLINKLLNEVAVPRVGQVSKLGVGIIYDNGTGTFTVYTPKHWCDLCHNKPAKFSFSGKKYDAECLELARLKEEADMENVGK